MTQDIVASKLANALIENVSSQLEAVASGTAIRGTRKKYGGLWVGGRVTLTPAELRFAPTAANRLMHDGDPATFGDGVGSLAVVALPGRLPRNQALSRITGFCYRQ